ncbi:hypothetical protein COLO4_02755 [Corchorus olitorius]|uniref:Uncharacterized protein n=1 Tax=Corchorus olitorius TaxID=93759 RepID=A0A1R3L0D8_9ROSI|nr:hypothetical protein COLO4_02755 [Corchorus olitorius]
MESMKSETRNDGLYMSAPGSTRRVSLESLGFLSVPTSPRRRSRTLLNAESCDGFEDFEFETSRRFTVDDIEVESKWQKEDIIPLPHDHQNHHSRKESLPAMAFADELFSDGKVRPLKLPPRLEYSNDDKQSSALSSPRSPLKLPFQRRSLWNDEFDPFMAALKNVKQEEENVGEAKNHRPSGSMPMSPFKDTNDMSGRSSQQAQAQAQAQAQINEMGLILPTTRQSETNSVSNKKMASNDMWLSDQNRQMGCQQQQQQVKKSPIKLEEPKGVVFARRARLVRMEAGQSGQSGQSGTRESSKRQKLKKFLLRRSASVGNISSQSSNATRESNSRPNIAKKFSFKNMGLTQYNEEKRVSQVTRMTLVQYTPKLLLCMGFGSAKYVH